MANKPTKILIAGVGNELRQDDAFGVLLAKKLREEANLPDSVKIMEIGSAGIHLVQQLFDKYDVLVLLDVVSWGGEPGTIHFKEIDVKDIRELPAEAKNEFMADMHYINPIKALMLAKALNLYPQKVLFLGCESAAHDEIGVGLSAEVNNSIPAAYEKIIEWLEGASKN